MKRFLTFFFFIVLCSNLNFAQSKHRVGLVGGANHYSLRGSDLVDDAESQYGYFFGFSYEYKINENFSLVTGITSDKKRIDYNSQFSNEYFDENGILVESVFKVNTVNKYQYFSIPLLLRYSFGKKQSFFVNGGFFIATTGKIKKTTKITHQESGYSYSPSTIDRYNFPFADDISGSDYGFSLGIGKMFKLNHKLNLSIELRDNFGVVNAVANISKQGTTGTIKTNTIYFMTQLSFDL